MQLRVLLIGAMLGLMGVACSDEAPPTEVEAVVGEQPAEGGGAPAAPEAEKKPAEEKVENAVGRVDAVVGTPQLTRGDTQQECKAGMVVAAGDAIKTGKGGKIRVVLKDESVLALGADSEATVSKLDMSEKAREGAIKVAIGKFWMKVAALADKGAKTTIDVVTPNAVAGIRGTTLWGDTERDTICALEGTIEVSATAAKGKKAKPKKLKAGQCVTKMKKGKLQPAKLKPADGKKYLGEVLIEP